MRRRIWCCLAFISASLAANWTVAQDAEPRKTDDGQVVLVRTPHLSEPLGKARQLTLYGMLGGDAELVLDPNWCALNGFGDPEICTQIALFFRQVKLRQVKQADPLDSGRRLFEVDGAGLDGRLYLVVPEEPLCGPYRFVHEVAEGRRVIGAERLVWDHGLTAGPDGPGGIPIIDLLSNNKKKCERIDFNNAQVVPGIVNDTYFLVVSGEKPYINMRVELVPRIYVRPPEYWEIDLVGCIEGEPVATPARYIVEIPLQGILGERGIELVGKSQKKRFDVPPGPTADEKRQATTDEQPSEQ